MDGKLTLNDGTELEYSTVTQAGNVLCVYCYAPVTFGQLFWLLNNPEKVAEITMTQGEHQAIFEGFTELFCIRKEDAGFISAGLRK